MRIRDGSVLVWLESDKVRLGGLSEEQIKTVTPELLRIERIAKLATSLEYVGPLLKSGYESARDIVDKRAREVFVEEVREVIADKTEAYRVYDAATGVVATTEALVLTHSPRFGGINLPVMPSNAPAAELAPQNATTNRSLTLSANLQRLFGNQDYCECAHGASLYGPAAYLADLLHMLARGPKYKDQTALQVLLTRRPDLAEIDLTADNTDITLPYIDLVLEILEAPVGRTTLRFPSGVGQSTGFDSILSSGTVPEAMKNGSQNLPLLGIKLGVDLDVRGTGVGPWRIRDKNSGIKYRLQSSDVARHYSLAVFPQSVAGSTKGYRPWSSLISTVVQNVGTVTFPWKLPFDITRDEANTWIEHLGATRAELMQVSLDGSRWNDADTACEYLNISPAERRIFTTAPTTEGHKDWGFADAAPIPTEKVYDPIAGKDRDPTPTWHELLKNVSLLRSRARLTHRELLNVLETRFVRSSTTARLEITGDECNAAEMKLEAIDAALAHRIHIFVRLWRKLGWSTSDLDRAIYAYGIGTNVGSNAVFTDQFLRFVANIVRLQAFSKLSVPQLLDLFGQSLDTTEYWDHASALPVRTLSRYQQWFDNSTLGKPQQPEFRFDSNRNKLDAIVIPDSGLPKTRISDHSTYIAAALAIPESVITALLPRGEICIPASEITNQPKSGTKINISKASLKEVEIVVGKISDNSTFSLEIIHSEDGDIFETVPATDFESDEPNPMMISASTQLPTRVLYTGLAKYLSCTITPPTTPKHSLWISVRVLTAPGVVNDEMSLFNLTTLCRYPLLSRLVGVSIDDLRTLITLSGANSFPDGPAKVLDLLEAHNTLSKLGLSITQTDQLLRGPDGSAAPLLNTRAESLLRAVRAEAQAIRDESTVSDDKRSSLLKTVLTGLGWNERLIADVLGPEGLGSQFGDYQAALDEMPTLPVGITLPPSMTHNTTTKRLTVSRTILPADLQHDLDPILIAVSSDLLTALQTIYDEASQRDALLKTTYEAPLYEMPTLPTGVALPQSVTYNATTKHLTVSQTILPADLQHDLDPILTRVSGDLLTALQTIYDEASQRDALLKTTQAWMRAKKLPTHQAELASQPLLISELPTEWKGRFYYDHSNKNLCVVGWITEADKTLLKSFEVSPPANSTFAAAIDVLSNASNNYPVSSDNQLVVRQGTPNYLTIETLLLDTDGLEARCGLVLERLLPEWRRQKLHTKLSAVLSQNLGIAIGTVEALLEFKLDVPRLAGMPMPSFEALVTDDQLLASDPATKPSRAAFAQAFDAAARLIILGELLSQQKMDATQVPWLGRVWNGLDLTAFPTQSVPNVPAGAWDSLMALSSLIFLRDNVAVGVLGLEKILFATPPDAPSIAYMQLAPAMGWSEDTLRVFASADGFNISTPEWFRAPSQLLRLVNCLEHARQMNMPASLFVTLKQVQSTSRSAHEAESEVQALRQMALGSSTGSTWSDAERKVLDGIRQRPRDATVDYLVQTTKGALDANDLYGHYLIDPQMSPCMMTSRIKQAISSVQLFIQRCFMNLEEKVPPNMIDKQHWEWMKNYRVWEANRKVLLYPENWIEPELRDDKTPFFDDVVSSLQQGDATSDKAQAAVQTFLEKLSDLSRVDIVATCLDYDDSGHLLVTHVFARTLAEPRTYWYRQFIKQDISDLTSSMGIWTAWLPIDLDIEGDHLFPFVWQGRLFLFWAIFSQEAEEPTDIELRAGGKPKKVWHLKLAWSEFRSGKWSSRKISSSNLIKIKIPISWPWQESFYFYATTHEAGATISVYGPSYLFSSLYFDGSNVRFASGMLGSLGIYPTGWDSVVLSETPIDDTPTAVGVHTNMKIEPRRSGPISLGIPKAPWQVTIQAAMVRSTQLLYPPNKDSQVFAAPSAMTYYIGGIPNNTRTTPFIQSDWKHQFFIYPTWQQKWQIIQGQNVDVGVGWWIPNFILTEVPQLHFYALDWPQATRLRKTLSDSGIDKLLSYDSQVENQSDVLGYFLREYSLFEVVAKYPDGDLEFLPHSATAQYNWELFFHVPFSIACNLSKNQRFEESRRWFHYIFDPTDNSDEPSAKRYWRFRPFRETGQGPRIDELVRRLANPDDHSPEKSNFQTLIAMWKDHPFQPHLVARMRIRSYMYVVVMKYLDNLIAWGDQLFRRDTLESLNEATQLYILAAQILGRRPEGIPRRTRPVLKSFSEISASQPDDLSNALVEAENLVPSTSTSGNAQSLGNLKSLYFCVPNNPKLLEYYDRVEDRLFKLRNCMNIDGVVRQLPLFEPAIDPSLLVRAAAAGVDVSSVLADLSAPLPFYRFNVMAQKATELCAEVKGLGAELLGAIEKGDAEAMALMRSGHELQMLKSVRLIKELQLHEAKANIDAIGVSLESAQKRFTHYVGLVSQMESLSIPTTPVGVTIQSLALAAIEPLTTAANFVQSSAATVNPIAADSMEKIKQSLARTAEALSATLPPESSATDKVPMNVAEKRQLSELKSAHDLQKKAMDQRLVAQVLAKIPDFTLGAQGWTSSPVIQLTLGGTLLSSFANFSASILDTEASEHTYRASLHSTLAGYQRRAADWLLQAELAAKEIEQITKQIAASNLRIAISSQELRNHDLQAENAQAVDEFMHSKYSNRELYNWMSGQLSNLHFQVYQLAYDVAKRAERCFKHELGVDNTFIKFGYWDNLKKGLLAGENLLSDLKRMEVAYLNQNARELEITKHISLRQLDPVALLALRASGECEFTLPEWLFDLDFPGHYFRRIKSVGVSVPCVVGPYTSVSGTLTILRSEVRTKPTRADDSADSDPNKSVSYVLVQSIATSTAQNDAGLFELNFRDERYLPFEGAGAESTWSFRLPSDFPAFDYRTISDLVLHVRYTARDGGETLRDRARAALEDWAARGTMAGSSMYSVLRRISRNNSRHNMKAIRSRSKLLTLSFPTVVVQGSRSAQRCCGQPTRSRGLKSRRQARVLSSSIKMK